MYIFIINFGQRIISDLWSSLGASDAMQMAHYKLTIIIIIIRPLT